MRQLTTHDYVEVFIDIVGHHLINFSSNSLYAAPHHDSGQQLQWDPLLRRTIQGQFDTVYLLIYKITGT
jgi:hypothetical protein